MDHRNLTQLTIQQLACPSWDEAQGNDIYLLRDDLLPFSFGGNKVRIAWEFVEDLRARGANALIMYGDRCSNLCRVLANLCHMERIPCVMIATAEADGEGDSFNARLVDSFDVKVITCAKDGIASAVDRAMELLKSCGYRPYYIYGSRLGTGNEGTAARAYAKVYQLLCQWEQTHDLHFDRIVVPYGTGSTQGGLVAGSIVAGDGRAITGISISSRTPERARSILAETAREWLTQQGLPCPDDLADRLDLQTSYNLGGYGRANQRVYNLIDYMLKEHSVPLDPTYTGKAFRGMLDFFADHDIHGERVLFVHTGGLPLFFDYLNAQA